MYGLSSLALLASIASTAVAQLNTTVEYRLKSDLKANQTNGVLYQDLVSQCFVSRLEVTS